MNEYVYIFYPERITTEWARQRYKACQIHAEVLTQILLVRCNL
jgi:hypothetical protein